MIRNDGSTNPFISNLVQYIIIYSEHAASDEQILSARTFGHHKKFRAREASERVDQSGL